MPEPCLADDLRDALSVADFTYDRVVEVLGPVAHAALSRNETTPGLRATTGGTPVETLTRLWLLQATVTAGAADAALPGLVDRLCAEGILERSVGEVAARVDVRPYGTDTGHLWVASDLTPRLDGAPNAVGPDHVLGISSAATSLAEMTVRTPVGRALDLGTGCGVQSLHLAAHADHVVATDVNTRALWLTRLNAGLNRVDLDVREGSFFEPVRGETFDLVVTNPPFVISPATGERLVYRDSGLPGDRVVEHIVRTVPGHLVDGGLCQVLGNWMVLEDQPWEERLSGWVEGCDAWVVQRETVDLPTYVELWLKDAGLHRSPDYVRRYDTWLAWFDEQGAEAVGSRPCASSTGRTTWPSRSATRSPPTSVVRRSCARSTTRRSSPRDPPPGSTSCRRRWVRRAPRTRARSCSASSSACAAPGRSTPSRRPWSEPATAS